MIIQDKGNTTFKLTIAKNETRLKVRDGATAEEIDQVTHFAEKIDQWVRPHFTVTLRGQFEYRNNQWKCSLHYGKSSLSLICRDDPFVAKPSTHWEEYLHMTEEIAHND